jgi:hypothetical protein
MPPNQPLWLDKKVKKTISTAILDSMFIATLFLSQCFVFVKN